MGVFDGFYRRRRWLSPLTVRIMAVNMIALGILGGGVLYLNQFRTELVDRRAEELRIQTRIIAGALGEAATSGGDFSEKSTINIDAARQILGRLVGGGRIRARLFAPDGALIADSRFMFLGQSVIAVELPPLKVTPNWRERLLDRIDQLLAELTRPPQREPYRERPDQVAADYAEAITALAGEEAGAIRSRAEGAAIISIAAPVQRLRRVQGALMVSADTADIEALIRGERVTILKIFAASLGVTMLMSFFLAGTIVRPIRRLAAAADRVRGGMGRDMRLPDYIRRNDEIGDLSRSIADMTQALNHQIDAVEAFAADVAHELKNPLSSVRSAVESMERTDDPALKAKLLAIIVDDVRRLDRLISDISDASRLDAELSRAETQSFDLASLCASLIDVYRTTTAEPYFLYEGPEAGSVKVAGIEMRIGQVIRNLIDNAISFSPKNGGIHIHLEKHHRLAQLRIEDDGPGLPPQNIDDIFRRFYSERPANEAFGTHSGLGLAISKQIVEAHGGHIRAENRIDGEAIKGARFVIELPLAR